MTKKHASSRLGTAPKVLAPLNISGYAMQPMSKEQNTGWELTLCLVPYPRQGVADDLAYTEDRNRNIPVFRRTFTEPLNDPFTAAIAGGCSGACGRREI